MSEGIGRALAIVDVGAFERNCRRLKEKPPQRWTVFARASRLPDPLRPLPLALLLRRRARLSISQN